MNKKFICLLVVAVGLSSPAFASDSRDHAEKEDHETHEEEKHGDGDEHDEPNSKVGPEKGILEVSEESGFKLSPEAIRNFELKLQKLDSAGPWELPLSAQFFSQEEVNIFRVRDGFFKRIDFILLSKMSSTMKITSSALKIGDVVVAQGVGFLRIAELTAFGGAPEGHSH